MNFNLNFEVEGSYRTVQFDFDPRDLDVVSYNKLIDMLERTMSLLENICCKEDLHVYEI